MRVKFARAEEASQVKKFFRKKWVFAYESLRQWILKSTTSAIFEFLSAILYVDTATQPSNFKKLLATSKI